jgi:hypothetical protein
MTTPTKQGDEDLDVPEPIPHARAVAEVYLHTATRGAQAGSILFTLLAFPVCLRKGLRGGILLRRLGQASLIGSAAGGGFMAVGTYRKLATSGAWGAYDRAYRLRNNDGQVILDTLSYTSAAVGLFVGTVLLNKGLYGGLVGVSSGLSLGVLEFGAMKMYQGVGLTTYERYLGSDSKPKHEVK